jgi:type IV secretory pathway VirB3-like protein
MYVLVGIFLFVLWFGNGRIWYYFVLCPAAFILMRALVEYDPNFWRIFRLWLRTKFKAKRHVMRLWGGSYLAALPCGVADDPKDVASAL